MVVYHQCLNVIPVNRHTTERNVLETIYSKWINEVQGIQFTEVEAEEDNTTEMPISILCYSTLQVERVEMHWKTNLCTKDAAYNTLEECFTVVHRGHLSGFLNALPRLLHWISDANLLHVFIGSLITFQRTLGIDFINHTYCTVSVWLDEHQLQANFK